MNALLVGAAPTPGARELLPELAARHDLVIAVDGGGDLCVLAGVVPNALVGDLDSISPGGRASLVAAGSAVLTFPADKDETDLELAFAHASSHGASRVTVTAVSAGRLDHTLAALAVLAQFAELCPSLIEPGYHGWLLAPSGRLTLTVDGTGGLLSLLPWGGAATVSAEGLKWPLDRERLEPVSPRGVSNVLVSDGASITVHSGLLWVVAPHAPGAVRVSSRQAD